MHEWRRIFGLAVAVVALGAAADVGAATMESFGRCLKSRGATFYGASWCPHCHAQRETLGDAMSYVRYVECAVDGTHESTPACHAAKIDGYPTWVFGDGSRASGEQSLAELAAKTACELPKSAR